MTTHEHIDHRISAWLEAEAPGQLPDRVLTATFDRTRRSRQHRGWRTLRDVQRTPRPAFALAAVAVVAMGVIALGALAGGSSPTPLPSQVPAASAPPDASPSAAPSSTPTVRVSPPVGDHVLGWSSDGSRLLVMRDGDLFVLGADGSETQVTHGMSALYSVRGSGRPVGAAITPDGTHVIYAGLTKRLDASTFCHDGALFVVDVGGGPAELFWKSSRNGIVDDPVFAPDGTQVAFVDNYCDSDQTVWLANADGTNAHPIGGPIGMGHLGGLKWLDGGDRVGLYLDSGSFTFARDGSDYTGVVIDPLAPSSAPGPSVPVP
jgi:hypothetical protein